MLRILLADDHAVVRQGVKQILADAFAKATFGEAQNTHELLELVASERWDIVVLDLTMPGGSGLEALKQWRQKKSVDLNLNVGVVFPANLLENLAVVPPADVEALANLPGMRRWRAREFGEEILQILRSEVPQDGDSGK